MNRTTPRQLRLPALLASLVLAATCACTSSPGRGASAARSDASSVVTAGWSQSAEAKAIAAVPDHAWRADGTALVWQRAPGDPPDAPETFVSVDPQSGARARVLDAGAAAASLAAVAGDAPPEGLDGWPAELDEAGRRALWIAGGDVWVLDLDASRWTRVTDTEAEEKAARFSPDGTRVSFVRENDLYVAALAPGAAPAETRLTRDGSETLLNGTLSWVYWEEVFGRNDVGSWWSPDSRTLAYLQTDESAVEVSTFVDFQPASARVIRQRYPKAGTTNPTVRLGLVDAAGGETRWVDLSGTGLEYLARVQWLPDGRRLTVQTMPRDQRSLDLWLVDAVGEAAPSPPRHVLKETDDAWVNIQDDLVFLGDGSRFLWVSERDGHAHVYLYRLDGTLVNRVTHGDWSLRASSSAVFWFRQAIAAVDEERGLVYFTALAKSSIEKHLYRIRLDGSGMECLTCDERGTHAVAFSPDARAYFDTWSNAERPPELRLVDLDSGRKHVLAPAQVGRVAELGAVFPDLFEIPARDGFRMPAMLYAPAGYRSAGRRPVILHVYAGPSAPMVHDDWNTRSWFDTVLVREGYLVLRVDNRSATAISKPLENAILGQMSGDSEVADIQDAVGWLKRQPWADPERVGIWGWSGGGTVTLLMMTRTDEFRAGIAVAPVTDWRFYDTKWAEFAMKTPEANPAGYAHTNLVDRAKDLHGRLLLVHGTYDDNVHPQNSWAFIDALVEAGLPFDTMWYPMRKHGIADEPARRHLYEKMLAFWKERL